MDTEKYIKCWENGRCVEVPLEDYLDMEAHKCGFDSYVELKKAGLEIDLRKRGFKDDK